MSYKSRIPQIRMQLEPRVDRALQAGAALVMGHAQARVRVATGALRDAIHVEPLPDGSGYEVKAGNSKVFYGHIVEHGGNNTPPHPFMVPAAEESRDEVLRLGKEALAGL